MFKNVVITMNKVNLNALRRTAILGIIIIGVFEIFGYYYSAYNNQIQANELYEDAFSIETEIESTFLSVYTVTDAYVSFLQGNENLTSEENEEFLSYLLSYEDSYIRNIAFIEDTTIKFNFPYAENSSSIGIDLSKVDSQKEDVLYVKNTLDSILIGPVSLVQGGEAFIFRTPITRDNVYVGQVSSVIDNNKLIASMTENADSQDISIIVYDGTDIIQIGSKFDGSSVTKTITDDYFNWDITVYSNSNNYSSMLVRIGLRVMAFLIINIIGIFVFRNRKLHSEILYKAKHDSLTNTFNRAKFVEDFENNVFSDKLIAFADINKFKILNDTLGHHFGDWGLIEITKKINAIGKFITYRISGDEFIIASIDRMTEDEFLNYIDYFNASIYNNDLNQQIEITLSIGVIEDLPPELTLETTLVYLDYAMYDAKKEGKTYTLVDKKLREKYADQKQIEETIIHDINNNNLHVYYHPIINVKTGQVEGVEALSRWIRDDKLVPAYKFIEIVKKIKYIEKVDWNLFNNIQDEYKKLLLDDYDISDLYFAINLSAETLKMFERNYQKFDEFVKNRIIPKDKIIFEISEDVNLGIISQGTLEYIQSKGYELTIDDFGSGVSKLTDVLSGQLLAIKTDKSMVPLSTSEDKKYKAFNTILKAINASGSNVCVEGIETPEQLDISIKAGAKAVQGYLFSKPFPSDKLLEFLKSFTIQDYLL